ncbi:MAG TPA: DNA mismatch repair protein MutS [Candidatus Limnocylindria bacterium]|nr:DNA mismatch repair protein MutS [Candidatus Limnocylindria bacterium]
MAGETQLTPMMAQYRRIKAELPKDALLFFRLGDFYELFFEDAQIGAQLLNVALTQRQAIPMCGIPYHAANTYIGRLLKAGKKVAICDQTEEARPGKLVERQVTTILSPGTHFDDRLLVADQNNFLAAVCNSGSKFGLACVDLTTGDFRVTELADIRALSAELDRLRPAEIVHPSESFSHKEMLVSPRTQLSPYEGWTFLPDTAVFTLRDHFKVASLDGFGLKDRPAAIGAAGAALHFLVHHLRRDTSHLTRITFYQTADYLVLDAISLRNLEVLEPLQRDAARNLTLFGAMNRTTTPMGARRLRDWLTQPLSGVDAIHRRQAAVDTWIENPSGLEAFRGQLTSVRDLERTLSRISLGSGNGRDLSSLRAALEKIPSLREIIAGVIAQPITAPQGSLDGGWTSEDRLAEGPDSLLAELLTQLKDLPDLVNLLARAIVDEPPLALKEGGIIRDGYSADLDELRGGSRDGKGWIAKLQQDEIARTAIPSLKVGFNSVFGYYIEITKTHLAKVPPEYIRKQTIANGERFVTQELKTMEQKILGAEERSMKLEYDLFLQLREQVLVHLRAIQETASALAQLDVLAAFAETARLYRWVRPEVRDEGVMNVRDGRHPVLEQVVSEERFIPNDTELDVTQQQIALITGPNMAGKSTYIRQVALLALLAHTGSRVPAEKARIDLLDRIFTRIGASDDLARGQSTFMVEMSETANILNNATRRGLVILDEIGRGTSTFDGLSLAWSIVEHLHHQVGAKTLFATHYHELTELSSRLPRVKNYHVAVREWNDQIVFLRKVQPGGTDKSYGIQVARLAGVPRPVIDRAKDILRVLEEAELNLQHLVDAEDKVTPEEKAAPAARAPRVRNDREKLRRLANVNQMDLFG